jgi:hypothetical protein
MQNFHLERFDLRNLDDIEVKGEYQLEIWNRFVRFKKLRWKFWQ